MRIIVADELIDSLFNHCSSGAYLQRSDGRTSVPCYRSGSRSVDRDRRAGPAAQRDPGEKVKRESRVSTPFPY